MNSHALGVLEYGAALELVASRAATDAGADRTRGLTPSADLPHLETEHAQVSAMRAMIESDAGWVSQPIPDLASVLSRLRIPGAPLIGQDCLQVLTALRSSRLTRDVLAARDAPPAALAVLHSFRQRLISEGTAEAAIDRVVDADGNVKDGASSLLRRLRRELRGAEGELVQLLERMIQQLDPRVRVSDMSVTVRNGRYVIPIRREGKDAVGGLVHDASSTGATLFVEPPAAIAACNRIRELEAEAQHEVDRILMELTDALRPIESSLGEALESLTDLDSLFGRARFGIDFACGVVRLVTPGTGVNLKLARHPLLVDTGVSVVPFDLEMSPAERTLLVSGPNTGGKTVLLKTIGLLSMLAQAGVPVPVETGSSIVVYDDIFADVGDEQSIEASLSTFSAHVRNMAEILRSANERSLVLLDEVGSGTDPLEGAALGGAVLEELMRRRAMTVATTHLGALKELASEHPAIVNASLQFDGEAMAPTYRLIKGIPGQSYGISIARRLRLPEDVLKRAEERIPQIERDVNALLVTLEKREAELSQREALVREIQEAAQERAHRLADQDLRLRERERKLERESRQEARRYVLEARAEVERTIKALKRSSDETRDEAARSARQQLERVAENERQHLEALDAETRSRTRDTGSDVEVQPGDLVLVRSLNDRVARLLEIRDGECVVLIGSVKLSFARSDVARAGPGVVVAPRVSGDYRDLPDANAATEVDVRGMRLGEVDEIVLQALDAAIRADLPALRIIHGKGTGALRERVAELLRKDTRVRSFRLGVWNEGGAGVTLAEL